MGEKVINKPNSIIDSSKNTLTSKKSTEEKEKEKRSTFEESFNIPEEKEDEYGEYLKHFTSAHRRLKNTRTPAFHHASNKIYKTVLLAFEHAHKNRIDWVATNEKEEVDMEKSFIAAKKQLYELLDIMNEVPNGLTQFMHILLKTMVEEKWTKTHFFFMVTLIPYFCPNVAAKTYDYFFEEVKKAKKEKGFTVS